MMKEGYDSDRKWLDGSKDYNIKGGYRWLKGQYEQVNWHNWVWSLYNVPKHCVIAWVVALGRVRTKDRLRAAGICNDDQCMLCVNGTNACTHLFFRCAFSRSVCSGIMDWLNIRESPDEYVYVTWRKWGRKYKSRRMQQVCYCALAATVYYGWRARNISL